MFRTVVCVLAAVVCLSAQERQKQFKPGETERYNEAIRDVSAGSFAKAVTDLDGWKQQFPDSDYRDERDALYVQAYSGVNQPVKTMDVAAGLIAKGLEIVFPGPGGQPLILRLLYSASWAITQIPKPTAEEMAASEKAAKALLAADAPLPGVPADKWAEARLGMKQKAMAALVYLAMLPGMQAMQKQPPDCAGADAAYSKALGVYGDQALISYELGRALLCEARKNADKEPAAIYEFERAAQVDATLGGARNDPKAVQSYADGVYTKFHGNEDGLAELRQLVKRSALPPAGFTIESAEQIAARKEKEFDDQNPQLALWMKIKTALTSPDGQQYFENELKDTAVPQLSGKLLEAKPACRPRELLVAITQPGVAEILIKLDRPLTGKVEPGAEFRWEGVPSTFTAEPFLLTMDTEVGKVDGLSVTPCSVAPRAGKK
jgi:hypothetical protein